MALYFYSTLRFHELRSANFHVRRGSRRIFPRDCYLWYVTYFWSRQYGWPQLFWLFAAAFAGMGLAIKFTFSFLNVTFVTYFNSIHAVCT